MGFVSDVIGLPSEVGHEITEPGLGVEEGLGVGERLEVDEGDALLHDAM